MCIIRIPAGRRFLYLLRNTAILPGKAVRRLESFLHFSAFPRSTGLNICIFKITYICLKENWNDFDHMRGCRKYRQGNRGCPDFFLVWTPLETQSRVPIASRGGSVPVFLRKHIATCNFAERRGGVQTPCPLLILLMDRFISKILTFYPYTCKQRVILWDMDKQYIPRSNNA